MMIDHQKSHPTYVEIDAAALRSNLRLLQAAIGPDRHVILVVKSDAYGHGALPVSEIAVEEGISHFAVATVDEAIQLRKAAIVGEIMLLHASSPLEVPALLKWKITPTLSTEETAKAYSDALHGQSLPVQVEINTGLSRLGFDWETAGDAIARIVALPGLKLTGVFTHYRAHYSAVTDPISVQTERYLHVLNALRDKGIDPGLRHTASSYPAAYHAETFFDGIRVGILAFGSIEPPPPPLSRLRPVMSVFSHIMHLRTIQDGDWVHYGDSFQAHGTMRIAVIPIGYGMGLPRHLSNEGYVLIEGERCPIVGVIGMDLTMADVSAIPRVKAGDRVTIIGLDGDSELSAVEVGGMAGTIAHEIICRLGNGLPRFIVNNHQQ